MVGCKTAASQIRKGILRRVFESPTTSYTKADIGRLLLNEDKAFRMLTKGKPMSEAQKARAREYALRRRQNMTEAQRQAIRRQAAVRRANRTPEQIERDRIRSREYARNRTPEQKARARERALVYRQAHPRKYKPQVYQRLYGAGGQAFKTTPFSFGVRRRQLGKASFPSGYFDEDMEAEGEKAYTRNVRQRTG